MPTVKVPGFIHAERAENWERPNHIGYMLRWRSYNAEHIPNAIDVCPYELSIDVPDDWNPVPEEIAGLEAKRAEVLAAAQVEVNKINNLIGKLQALTYEAA
jgi:hypothetical protein